MQQPDLHAAKIEVDRVSVGIPARRFHIKSTIAFDTSVPLVTEFVLRLTRLAGDIKLSTLQRYFGFSNRETMVLLGELTQLGLLEFDGEYVQLGPQGREAFRGTSEDDPRIVAAEQREGNIAFERVTATPLERVRYDTKVPRGLIPLPIRDREKAARLADEAAKSFQRHFKEIATEYFSLPKSAQRAYVYSVDEVSARRTFTYELSLPIVLAYGSQANCSVDFGKLYERGLRGSRDELIALVAEHCSKHFGALTDGRDALDFVSEFDGGALTGWFSDLTNSEAQVRDWANYCVQFSQQAASNVTVPFVGSNVAPHVHDLLVDRTSSGFGDETPEHFVYWLRPSVPYWGRSSAFELLIKDLSRLWAPRVTRVLLATSEDSLSEKDLVRAFRRDGDEQLFSIGLILKQQTVPGSVEVILRPGGWVMAIVYLVIDENSPHVPVGFFSTDDTIVRAAEAAVANRIPPLKLTAHFAWGYPKVPFEQTREVLEQDIAMWNERHLRDLARKFLDETDESDRS